jgi:hypothetical protein
MFPETRMDMVRIGILQVWLMAQPSICQFLSKNKIDPLQELLLGKVK